MIKINEPTINMISFVYFDLGGVVIRDLNGTGKWIEIKRSWGITAKNDQDFERFYGKYEAEVCVGRDTKDFSLIVNKKFGLNLPENYSLVDDLVNRFEENKSIWPIIGQAKKLCRIGLLTNMYPGMLEAINKRGIMPKIDWEAIIDSSLEGLQKPDPRIFELGEKKADAKGKQILFVENSSGHVQSAQDFGWQTFFYNSADLETSNRELSLFLSKITGSST